MGNREEYNSCMRPHITGSKPKEQRKMDFCVGAKICSGKASSREEALQVCSLPKQPKIPKKSPRQREKEQEACNPGQFFEVATQFKNLYINVHGDRCLPCAELDQLIKEAEVPFTIVNVPESCIEILSQLGVIAFPTVLKMSAGKVVSQHNGPPEEIIAKMKLGQ